ncbi:MAG TPA: hypothetical protein VMJ34_21550 [Bryobacteraceae bacterium]|nr:hypothetical protein [Bryobacteraceae bacterium]
MFRYLILTTLAFASAGALLAQEPAVREQHEIVIQRFGDSAPMTVHAGGGNFGFISAEMSFEGKTVAGAPFTAEAVNESTQTLADGNRISRTTKSLIARDSAGRVRREQSLAPGLIGGDGQPMKLTFIHDPVAQTAYVLNPDHTAQKMPLTKGPVALSANIAGPALPPPAPGMTAMVFRSAAITAKSPDSGNSETKDTTESLGEQTVEGVAAEGTRTTSIIPAGAIGNEKEIRIVNETWYSNELQTMVSSTHTDPRFGTTTYRLTNIQRSEPSPDLFQVPADYTVRDAPKPGAGLQFDYKIQK